MQLNRDNARLTELHGQSENSLRGLRREHEQLSHVAKEIAALKRENDILGQQRVQVTYERDQLRAELDRSIADLTAERQARLADLEERRRGDARLQVIEERLAQLRPHDSTVPTP
jgi:septal ring factor EnvC (AmiA/AmiB activator)